MVVRVNRKALVVLLVVIFALAAGTIAVLRSMLNKGARSEEFLRDARAYAAQGQYDSAVIQYKTAIKYNPENVAAQIELGDLYVKHGDLSQAYECFKAASSKNPSNVDVLSKLAALYHVAGKWDDLRKAAATIVSLAPGGQVEAQAHHYLGQTYYRDADWRRAAAEFSKAAEMNKADLDAVLSVALINAQKLGAPEEAQLGLKELLSRASDESLDPRQRAEAALRAAKFYWAAGKPSEAEKMLSSAITLVPNEASYRVQAGDFYKQRGRDAESVALAERNYLDAVKVEPTSISAQLALGLFYRETSRLDNAVEVFRKVVAGSSAPLAYQYLVESLIDKGDLAGAADEIEALRKIRNAASIADYLEGRLNIVASGGSRAKLQKAGDLLRRVTRERPDFAPAHYYLGLTDAAEGMLDDAAVEFQRTLEIQPGFDSAALALAETYVRFFQYDKAIAQARGVLEHDRNNYLANLIAGRALAAQGNLSGARTFLEQARSANPASGEPLIALADVLSRQGKTAEAAKLLEDTAKYTDDATRAMMALSAIYQKQGDAAKALEAAAGAAAADNVSATAFYASLLWQQGRAQEALDFLVRRAKEYPSRADYEALLGDFQRSMGKGEEALASYKRALQIEAANAGALAGMASAYVSLGKFSEARSAIAELRKSDPGSSAADMAEAAALASEGKADAAAAILENNIRRNPSNAEAYYRLALIEQARGKLDQATEDLKNALRFSPSWVAARLALAQIYYQTRFYEDALREARLVTGASDVNAAAISQATDIAVGSLVQTRRLDEAIAQWSQLPPEIQGTGDYMLKLGYLYMMRQDYARAEEAFKAALPALKDVAAAYEGLARVYLCVKNYDAAAATVTQALGVPVTAAGRVRLMQLAANINLAKGNVDLAVNALTEMERAAGKDPALLVQTGDAFTAMGRNDKALEAYELASDADDSFTAAKERIVESLIKDGRSAQAGEIVDKMLKARPDDLDWVVLKAETLLVDNTTAKAGQAADILNAALAARSGGVRNARARFLLGDIYYRLGQVSTAETELRKALSEDPTLVPARMLLARTLVANRAYEEAAVIANDVIKENPAAAEAYAVLGDVEVLSGDIDAAVGFFRKALSIQKDPAVLRALVAVLTKSNRHDEALAEVTTYLAAVPGDADTARMLGSMYEARGKYSEAEAVFTRLLEADKSDTAAAYALSKVYKDQGKLADAESLLASSIQANPTPLGYRYLAGIQALAGKQTEAETSLRTAVKKYPDYLDAYVDLAALLSGAKRVNEAVAALKDAVDASKDKEAACVALGRFYVSSNMQSEAGKFLKDTADANPKFAGVLTMLGGLCLARGDRQAALAAYEKAVKFSPDNAQACNALAYLLADDGVDAPRAIKLATFAASKLPNNADVLDTLGWAYYRDGQFANAVANLSDAARAASPASPAILYHLSLAYAKVGAAARAKETAQQLIALDPSYAQRGEVQEMLSQK